MDVSPLAPWPGALDGETGAVVRDELIFAASSAPPEVRARLGELLSDAATRARGVALAWLIVALARGGHAVIANLAGVDDELDGVLARDGDGREIAVPLLVFDQPEHAMGRPADVARLLRALETALGAWRFVVHLRRAVPADFDPTAVARAVLLWRTAIDSGEWRGRHAIYEDEIVSIDLSVTERRTSGGHGGAIGVVPPIGVQERMVEIQQRCQFVLMRLDEVGRRGPVAVAVAGVPRWRLSRGFILEALYGLADRTSVVPAGDKLAILGAHASNPAALFADPSARDVVSMWWLERGEAWGVPSVVAYDNPWATAPAVPLRAPGRAYRAGGEEGVGRRRLAVMRWEG